MLIGLTGNFLKCDRDEGRRGLPIPVVRRRILASRTFFEATEAVYRSPRSFSANLMISHDQGEAMDFEATPDEVFWIAIRNSAVYAALVVVPVSALALFLAVLVNQKLPFVGVFRSAYYLPVVTSISVIAIIWAFTFVPRADGPVNYLIGLVGIPPQDWLISPDEALPTVALMGIWSTAGYYMILWLAGLQSVPEELEEAARIDGAGRWNVFWNVTLPLLRPTTIFIAMIATIGALQVFGAAYVLTGGGPVRATTTVVYYIWQAAFGTYRMGYGAAVSVILFIIVLVIALLQRRFLGWSEELY